MPLSLPEAPSLEHLKRRAKSLHKAVRNGSQPDIQLVREFNPRFTNPEAAGDFRLAQAQFTIARQYGFVSWTQLKQYVALRDPAVLEEAFQTVKDGWISVEDVPGDPAKLRRMLREYPGMANARAGSRGYTLLHYAAYRDYVEIARDLLAAGADPHARSWGGATPLAVALTYPAPRVARLLDGLGRVPDNLRIAAGLGDVGRMAEFFSPAGDLLPEAGLDREDWSRSYEFPQRAIHEEPVHILGEALVYAAQNNQMPAAELLLERGAEPNRISLVGTPLHWAALYGQREMADFLLSHGADPNRVDDEHGATAAAWADFFGHGALAEYLIARGTRISMDEGTWYCHLTRVKILLEREPGLLTEPDGRGNTLLHRAVTGGADAGTIAYLLERGTPVNAVGESGTALDIALGRGHADIIEVLRRYGGVIGEELR